MTFLTAQVDLSYKLKTDTMLYKNNLFCSVIFTSAGFGAILKLSTTAFDTGGVGRNVVIELSSSIASACR